MCDIRLHQAVGEYPVDVDNPIIGQPERELREILREEGCREEDSEGGCTLVEPFVRDYLIIFEASPDQLARVQARLDNGARWGDVWELEPVGQKV